MLRVGCDACYGKGRWYWWIDGSPDTYGPFATRDEAIADALAA